MLVFCLITFEDSTAQMLEQQENAQQENHAEILGDLASIREKAKEVWEKIGIVFDFVVGINCRSAFVTSLWHISNMQFGISVDNGEISNY